MLYAFDSTGKRLTPAKGAAGTCPQCMNPVGAKCGNRKIWHWAHAKGRNECDPWAESETQWHRDWQSRADPEWCEVVMGFPGAPRGHSPTKRRAGH
ncbi:competence protein CoiA family protein [Pendulispora brunnea]|uniref:competence protein CoiA family protein n=1 Tax=Pendulispora brunnea TaxID=2905690 RepID=UPI00374E14FC